MATFSKSIGLALELFPYQEAGVKALHAFNGRALLADEMGLGKTPQAIAYAALNNRWPVIVVCPASLRYNWKREFLRWYPALDEADISVLAPGKKHIGGQVIITSYELAAKLSIELASLSPELIILDESHYIKNGKALRTKRLTPLCRSCKRVLLLTGTPVLNRPVELHSQLMALKLDFFGDLFGFARRYCRLHKGRFGWDMSGASNLPELNRRLIDTCMVRRLKADVLSDLPPKQRVKLILPPAVAQSAESLVAECALAFKRAKGNLDAARVALRKDRVKLSGLLFKEYAMIGSHKAEMIAEWALNNSSVERPLVVFAHHKAVLDVVCRVLSDNGISWIRIDGSTPPMERLQLVDKFQAGNAQVAVLSYAAREGLTFTRASDMLVGELPFGPGLAAQAEDRIHRVTQVNAALIRYAISERSLDEHLWAVINRKSAIASAILDGAEASAFAGTGTEDALSAGVWEIVEQILLSLKAKSEPQLKLNIEELRI